MSFLGSFAIGRADRGSDPSALARSRSTFCGATKNRNGDVKGLPGVDFRDVLICSLPIKQLFPSLLRLRELLLDEGGDEARHVGGEVCAFAHQMDGCEFGLRLPGEIGFNPVAQALAGTIDLQ